MANLTVRIFEKLTLDDNVHDNVYEKTFSGVNYIDHRRLNASSGSNTSIFKINNNVAAGTFVTSSIVYGRVSNLSTEYDVSLQVSSSTESFYQRISPGGTYVLSSTEFTGSAYADSSVALSFDQIEELKVEPISGSAKIEYYITTS